MQGKDRREASSAAREGGGGGSGSKQRMEQLDGVSSWGGRCDAREITVDRKYHRNDQEASKSPELSAWHTDVQDA